MFKFVLGLEVESKVSKIRGIITSRSENLYGCNRYYIQLPMSENLKVEGWWVDEEDVKKIFGCYARTLGGRKVKKTHCKEKMKVTGNWECAINRKRYLGLGQCLCRKENCPKLKKRA